MPRGWPRGKSRKKKDKGEIILSGPRPPRLRQLLFGDQGKQFPLLIEGVKFGDCRVCPGDIQPKMPVFVDEIWAPGMYGDSIRLHIKTEYQGQQRRLEDWIETAAKVTFVLGPYHLRGWCSELSTQDRVRWHLTIAEVFLVPEKQEPAGVH